MYLAHGRPAGLAVVLLLLGCSGGGPEPPAGPERIGDKPPPRFRAINAHEHLQSPAVAPRLLQVMDELGVVQSVILGGSRRTTHGLQHEFVDQEINNGHMLEVAAQHPDRFIPYVTIDPLDPDKLSKLRNWIRRGAKGLKLYSGHAEFHTAPLNSPEMMEVYAWCEQQQVPILFHVNGGRFLDEFEPILQQFPRLQIICPHFCLLSGRPTTFNRLMDSYPQLMTDISFGVPQFMNQGLQRVHDRRDSIRAMVLRQPERFLWGSDVVVTRHRRKGPPFIRDVFVAYFRMLAYPTYRYQPYTAEYFREPELATRNGLHLPKHVLRMIYEQNFGRIRDPLPVPDEPAAPAPEPVAPPSP